MKRFLDDIRKSIFRAQIICAALAGFCGGLGVEQMFKGCS